ncbi:hypothetical protein CONLIGDRAFT_6489 [Coniochaeta ligniaria NRRL 30616]|uniref:Uncharacterized protein n=1 Tax=Coniochaeta ligniaria NRRL 30616 TaxID=1408157 RepID=A0A1J7JM51_9PEZI|nr:hypothetical protein CONLIGDRAFT_6489 [Coniochaeta ligniaria NRRL 30616]
MMSARATYQDALNFNDVDATIHVTGRLPDSHANKPCRKSLRPEIFWSYDIGDVGNTSGGEFLSSISVTAASHGSTVGDEGGCRSSLAVRRALPNHIRAVYSKLVCYGNLASGEECLAEVMLQSGSNGEVSRSRARASTWCSGVETFERSAL